MICEVVQSSTEASHARERRRVRKAGRRGRGVYCPFRRDTAGQPRIARGCGALWSHSALLHSASHVPSFHMLSMHAFSGSVNASAWHRSGQLVQNMRTPQSSQSVPNSQRELTLPGPPSSHGPFAPGPGLLHVSTHTPGGGDGGGGKTGGSGAKGGCGGVGMLKVATATCEGCEGDWATGSCPRHPSLSSSIMSMEETPAPK